MWTVEQPDLDVKKTFDTCTSRVRDNQKNNFLRSRFAGVSRVIVAESGNFVVQAEAGEMFRVPQNQNVGGTVTTDEMVSLYDGRMAGKTGPGRSIYSTIKLLPEHDRCPFCDHRDVSTLDHILPKTLFPALAVTPLNLVGSCRDCNTAKKTLAPTSVDDAILHPYFDNVSDQTWLKARIIEQDVCAVLFRVKHRGEWSNSTNARLKAQFKTLGLNKLYSNQAAREMSGIRDSLIRKHDAGGAETVRHELEDQWRSRQVDRRNCWQTALYNALSRSDWYCDVGFRLGQ
jgi:hypothetical protein